jgi:hypothetical protein
LVVYPTRIVPDKMGMSKVLFLLIYRVRVWIEKVSLTYRVQIWKKNYYPIILIDSPTRCQYRGALCAFRHCLVVEYDKFLVRSCDSVRE